MEFVNHPSYYGGAGNPYEVIKVIEAWGLDNNFDLATVIKYLARQGKKPQNPAIQDLEKAEWYLTHEIEKVKEKQRKETTDMWRFYRGFGSDTWPTTGCSSDEVHIKSTFDMYFIGGTSSSRPSIATKATIKSPHVGCFFSLFFFYLFNLMSKIPFCLFQILNSRILRFFTLACQILNNRCKIKVIVQPPCFNNLDYLIRIPCPTIIGRMIYKFHMYTSEKKYSKQSRLRFQPCACAFNVLGSQIKIFVINFKANKISASIDAGHTC